MSSSINNTLSFLRQFSNQAMNVANAHANRSQIWNIRNPIKVNFNFKPNTTKKSVPSYSQAVPDSLLNNKPSIAGMDAMANNWFKTFFPNINMVLNEPPDEWADKILKHFGISDLKSVVGNPSFHAKESAALAKVDANKAQIVNEYSLRGFSLPPAAMMTAMQQQERSAIETIANVRSEFLIKQQEQELAVAMKIADLSADLHKFANSTATQLKSGIISASTSFFNSMVSLSSKNPNVDIYRAKSQAYSAYVSSLASFYNVELGLDKMNLDAERVKAEIALKTGEMTAELSAKGLDSANAAAAAAARGFADAAGAAANAQSSLQAELMSGSIG